MRRKKRNQGDVELNLAAMLDMAFQLLTFFILTFKPAPVEGQVSLRLPPPKPVAMFRDGQQAGADIANTNPVAGVNTLTVSILATPSGRIGSMAIGEGSVGTNLASLENSLKSVLSDPGSPFDQVILQVDPALHYSELMSVIDLCTRQTLPNGEKLSKLSFVELTSRP